MQGSKTLGAQPPAIGEVYIFKGMQSNEISTIHIMNVDVASTWLKISGAMHGYKPDLEYFTLLRYKNRLVYAYVNHLNVVVNNGRAISLASIFKTLTFTTIQ